MTHIHEEKSNPKIKFQRWVDAHVAQLMLIDDLKYYGAWSSTTQAQHILPLHSTSFPTIQYLCRIKPFVVGEDDCNPANIEPMYRLFLPNFCSRSWINIMRIVICVMQKYWKLTSTWICWGASQLEDFLKDCLEGEQRTTSFWNGNSFNGQ